MGAPIVTSHRKMQHSKNHVALNVNIWIIVNWQKYHLKTDGGILNIFLYVKKNTHS